MPLFIDRSARWRTMILAMLVVVWAFPALAGEAIPVSKDENDLAIEGFDTVAYHTETKAIAGKSEFMIIWQDAKWQFATKVNRDRFEADPEKFAPRYGGLCVMGMAQGKRYKANPEEFRIIDGRLYLNYSETYTRQFDEDAEGAIKDADLNWQELIKLN